MVFAKRVVLFLLTNILIMAAVSVVWLIVTKYFGIGAISANGALSYGPLMIYCLIWGFVGSFLSLALSRIMAKWMMKVQVIDPETATGEERLLYENVSKLAHRAGLKVCPQVGIYESADINAFATGPTRNRALVAVSSGLLSTMSKDEIEGVLAHEIAHVANGDMVTLTLVQGVVNAFVLFLAKVIGFFVGQTVKEESRATVEFGVSIAAQILLGILGSMVVAYFSRLREFKADAGATSIAGKPQMLAALRKLQRTFEPSQIDNSPVAAFKISSGRSGIVSLFSTHPPLAERIRRLEGTAA